MTIEEIKDTLRTWIKNADDEFDREEMGRVYGLKLALHLIENLDVPNTNDGDLISRQAAIDVVNSETVSTNPEHFKSSEKFIKFMDDTDIASFGKWQWANGFNTALVATTVQLKKLPSAERHEKWIPEFNGKFRGGSY